MDHRRSKTSALGFVLLGALAMLALEGAVWGGWKLFHHEDEPPALEVAAVPEEPASPPMTELNEPDEASTIGGMNGRVVLSEEEAAKFTAQAAAPQETEQPKDTEPPSDEQRTPEELLEEKAQESVEEAARKGEEEARVAEMERTFWAAHFDGYKKSMMEMIDGYFEQPMDERMDYIMEYSKKLRKQILADREAAEMSREIKNPQQVNQQFMRLLGERMNEEEKGKFKAYLADVIKMQQAMINAHLDAPAKKEPAAETPPPADNGEPQPE